MLRRLRMYALSTAVALGLPLLVALLLAVASLGVHAAPVDVVAVANGVFDQLLALSLVGGALLLLAGAISGFRYLRQVMGAGASASASFVTATYVPSVRGYSSAQEYLDSLASRLAAQDEFLGVDWRDESGKSNIDYMAEHGRAGEDLDRSQHSEAELAAYDKGLESWSMARERAEAFGEQSEFKAKDFNPPLSDSETAAHDAFEAGYVGMWASQDQRNEADASGSDMALYDRYVADDATHEEAMRWSDKAANAEVKVPTLGAGWSSSGEIKMPVLGPGWK